MTRMARGRPTKSAAQLRAETLEVRLNQLEKQSFREAAEIAGLSLSTWVRERLRQRAIAELEASGRQIPFLRHLYEG